MSNCTSCSSESCSKKGDTRCPLYSPRVLVCESCGWQGIEEPPAGSESQRVMHHRMQKVGHPFANLYILCDGCVAAAAESKQWVEHPLHIKEEGE